VTEIEKRIVDENEMERKTVDGTEVEKRAVGEAEHAIQVPNQLA
jgi:hypothetical protein